MRKNIFEIAIVLIFALMFGFTKLNDLSADNAAPHPSIREIGAIKTNPSYLLHVYLVKFTDEGKTYKVLISTSDHPSTPNSMILLDK